MGTGGQNNTNQVVIRGNHHYGVSHPSIGLSLAQGESELLVDEFGPIHGKIFPLKKVIMPDSSNSDCCRLLGEIRFRDLYSHQVP